MILENASSMPILGYYDNNIIKVSKSLGEAYNNSIVNLDPHKFLGFDLKLPKELMGLRGRLNKEDRVLEIHYNENTTLIVPSVYSNLVTTRKYFEISGEQNSLLEVSSLDESILLKGKAGGKKAFKAGMKSAKKFFTRDIEVKNPNDIRDLSENIASDLNKILGGEVLKKKEFVDFVKEFIENPHKGRSIDNLYQKMFDSAIQTKNLDKVIVEITKKINESRNYKGFLKGRSSVSNLKKEIADAYNVEVSQIEKRSQSEFLPKIRNAASIVVNLFKTLIKGLKAAITGGFSIQIAAKGIGSTIISIIEFCFWKLCSLLAWTMGISLNKEKVIEQSENIEGFLESFKSSFMKMYNLAANGISEAFEYIVTYAFSVLKGSMSWMESLPVLKYIKWPFVAILTYICIKSIISMFRSINEIKQVRSIDNLEVVGQMSREELTNNFGFDKILASEMIMLVISTHIQNAVIKNKGSFSDDELKRLEYLSVQIKNTGKKYCDDGIKLTTNYTKNIVKELISIF